MGGRTAVYFSRVRPPTRALWLRSSLSTRRARAPRHPPPPSRPQERHSDELRDFQQKLVSQATQPRHTKEYYNLREIQEKLAHQKNYAAAAKIKVKADELLAYEEDKWSNERQLEMLHRENVYKTRLSAEAETLRKRVAQGRAEQNRARQKALEKVLARYNNVKKEMDSSQRLERMKMDRAAAATQKGAGTGRAAPAKAGGGGGAVKIDESGKRDW